MLIMDRYDYFKQNSNAQFKLFKLFVETLTFTKLHIFHIVIRYRYLNTISLNAYIIDIF